MVILRKRTMFQTKIDVNFIDDIWSIYIFLLGSDNFCKFGRTDPLTNCPNFKKTILKTPFTYLEKNHN